MAQPGGRRRGIRACQRGAVPPASRGMAGPRVAPPHVLPAHAPGRVPSVRCRPGRRIHAVLPALPSVEWMLAAVTRSPTPASPGRSGMHPRVAGARHAAQQPRPARCRSAPGSPAGRAARATRATRASSSRAQRSAVRSSPSRYRRMASVTEPGLTSPRRASSVRTATATHGPSTRKCRRRAARVSDRPKPSVPRDE